MPIILIIALDCVTMSLRTPDSAGNEASWSLGTCTNDQWAKGFYSNSKIYNSICCLDTGYHTLVCKDSYGDGWPAGYLEINGHTYCNHFTSGYQEIKQLTFGGRFLRQDWPQIQGIIQSKAL